MVSGAFGEGGFRRVAADPIVAGNAVEDRKDLVAVGFLADGQLLDNMFYVGFEFGRYPEGFAGCLMPVVFLLAFQNVVFDPEEGEERHEDQGCEAVGGPGQS